jgi:anti-anti-sigma factor
MAVRQPDQEWAAGGPTFFVDAVSVEGCALLTLRGELDLATRETLHRSLQRAALTSRHIVVDLTDLDFVDAAGLSPFVEADRLLGRRSGRLTLRRPGGLVRRILDITGLDGLVEPAGSKPACIRCRAGAALRGVRSDAGHADVTRIAW